MTDEFDQRLRAADPAPREVDASQSLRARALLEQIMSEPTTSLQPDLEKSFPARRWLAAAAAVVAIAGIAGVALVDRDDADGGTMTLADGEPGDPMAMCLELTPEALAPVDVAFGGTVTEVDGPSATLEVTRWYKGGDASTVTVENDSPGSVALEGGVEFVVGDDFLVTATGGVLNSACGMSGPATPEYEALFDEAFPG